MRKAEAMLLATTAIATSIAIANTGSVAGQQLDLFEQGSVSPGVLLGLPVRLPDLCHCGSTLAAIESGRGPHIAGLRCACGQHRGWLSRASHKFLTETVRRFGRPTQPIRIRAPQARMTAPSGAGAA
jgi:hypothetical protein